ncbi:rna-directed dna polymerase from mobile element jockey-like [Pitangus sulphuratus]|nr:rna-directed dna polymerase from mobile element jockey-like [Pitangus sulphuratus]
MDQILNEMPYSSIVINRTKSTWRPVTSGILQGSTLNPVLFNLLINNLNDGAKYTLSKFADDTKLEEVFDAPDGFVVILKDLGRLKKWADKKLMQMKKGKCHFQHLEGNKPCSRLTGKQLDRKVPEILAARKLNTGQQCALVTRQASRVLCCTKQSIVRSSREVIQPLYSALLRAVSSAGLPIIGETWVFQNFTEKGNSVFYALRQDKRQ